MAFPLWVDACEPVLLEGQWFWGGLANATPYFQTEDSLEYGTASANLMVEGILIVPETRLLAKCILPTTSIELAGTCACSQLHAVETRGSVSVNGSSPAGIEAKSWLSSYV